LEQRMLITRLEQRLLNELLRRLDGSTQVFAQFAKSGDSSIAHVLPPRPKEYEIHAVVLDR
jgi:hypothetical protein